MLHPTSSKATKEDGSIVTNFFASALWTTYVQAGGSANVQCWVGTMGGMICTLMRTGSTTIIMMWNGNGAAKKIVSSLARPHRLPNIRMPGMMCQRLRKGSSRRGRASQGLTCHLLRGHAANHTAKDIIESMRAASSDGSPNAMQ